MLLARGAGSRHLALWVRASSLAALRVGTTLWGTVKYSRLLTGYYAAPVPAADRLLNRVKCDATNREFLMRAFARKAFRIYQFCGSSKAKTAKRASRPTCNSVSRLRGAYRSTLPFGDESWRLQLETRKLSHPARRWRAVFGAVGWRRLAAGRRPPGLRVIRHWRQLCVAATLLASTQTLGAWPRGSFGKLLRVVSMCGVVIVVRPLAVLLLPSSIVLLIIVLEAKASECACSS